MRLILCFSCIADNCFVIKDYIYSKEKLETVKMCIKLTVNRESFSEISKKKKNKFSEKNLKIT